MGLLEKAKSLKETEKKEALEKKPATEEKKPEKEKQKPEIKQQIYSTGKVIETDFDVLYKLVLQKSKMKISEVAKTFKIDKKKAEEWVTILDEHDLIKIHYPAMGEPEIRKIPKNEKIKE